VLTHYMAIFTAAMFCISSITACAARIGNKCSLDQTVFEIGRTTKNDVANTLGLPMKMKTDTESGTEYWGYRRKPKLVAVQLPAVDGNLNASVHTFHNYSAFGYADAFKNAAVIYAFNEKGVLIDVKDGPAKAN
jgi:hypothetical protein